MDEKEKFINYKVQELQKFLKFCQEVEKNGGTVDEQQIKRFIRLRLNH